MHRLAPLFSAALLVGVMGGCPPPIAWEVPIDSGFEGSPTYCDLDGDGAREAIVPVAPTDHPEISHLQVVDPKTGDFLWNSEDGDASFAYPLCTDVDRDGTLDLITGGRIRDIVALSGVDGSRLWSAMEIDPELPLANTYTAVSTRADFFVVTTGGGTPPGGTERFSGHVLAMGRDGRVLAQWSEPEGVEIYSSPAMYELAGDRVLVVVGSGGETRGGNLYLLELNTVTWEFNEVAVQPSGCETGGFIASATLGDITGDEVPEIVAGDWCGQVMALDLSGEVLWTADAPHPYLTGNPLLSDLDGDGTYDVTFASGEFNWSLEETFGNRASSITAFRGTDGDEIWNVDEEKYFWASPISADYDQDGTEDVWVVGADIADDFGRPPPSPLLVLSGKDGSTLLTYENASWMGTPLIDDIDEDGELDLLLMDAPFSATAFGTGFIRAELKLIQFPGVPFDSSASWSGFRGPEHDGFRR